MKFHGRVELNGKTATGIEVPAEVVTGLGAGKRPAVRATVNGFTYRTSVAPMGGRFLLPVSAQIRAGAGVAAGDEVDVDLEVDTEPRTVSVPADLAVALDTDPAVRRAFDALSYSQQLRYVQPVEDAKATATRQRRIDKVLSDLRPG
ncbi:MAG TPA: YdeI/OmpD-associated family protein [Streptosporangiaceae bacterium]|nr:YdeI/OmpD-associated family protein [Streptosporangiaceae bacterium]